MKPCERLWEVDSLGVESTDMQDEASLARHLVTCAECRARSADLVRLRNLGREMPTVAPTPLAARRTRTRILHLASTHRPASGRLRYVALAAALVALVVGGFIVGAPWSRGRRTSVTTPDSTTIVAEQGTSFRRVREGSIERVYLDDGQLSLHVEHQSADAHFFVEMPDAEIEVRGTRFEVAVRNGKTARVHVTEGRVVLRRRATAETLLHANDTWQADEPAPIPTVDVAQLPSVPARSASPIASSSARPIRVLDGQESAQVRAYADAMSHYVAGDWDVAAQAFHDFADTYPAAPEAEDAAFLEALALTRGGRMDAASQVAQRYLVAHPSSFHARDAAVIVARAARLRGDCPAALSVLRPFRSTPESADLVSALGACRAEGRGD